jgi:hypothetical protein
MRATVTTKKRGVKVDYRIVRDDNDRTKVGKAISAFQKLLEQYNIDRSNYVHKKAKFELKMQDRKKYSEEQVAQLKEQLESLNPLQWDKRNQAQNKFTQATENLIIALKEKHEAFDITDPALATALKLIELAPGKLSYETVQIIKKAMVGKQPGVKIVADLITARKITGADELLNMVYDSEEAAKIAQLSQQMIFETSAIYPGSVSKVIKLILKVKRLQGRAWVNMTRAPLRVWQVMMPW